MAENNVVLKINLDEEKLAAKCAELIRRESGFGWIDSETECPDADGEYLICTQYKDVTAMNYTLEGGWNTHREMDGSLSDSHAIGTDYVKMWLRYPAPDMA